MILPPVVVVGVGRSGTSLMQSMLHAHSEISFLPETHFFRRYVGAVLPCARLRWAGPRYFLETLRQDDEFARTGIDGRELLEPFLSESREFHPYLSYLRLLKGHWERTDARLVGDKDPRLIDFLSRLGRYVEGVRVVHLIRDPRDVLLSRRNAEWSRGRSDLSHVLAYRSQMTRGRSTGRRVLGDRYLEVRYEDLLDEPEVQLRRVCAHLRVGFEPGMLSFGEDARELVTDDEWQWKKETTGPLIRDNMRKWEGELETTVRVLTEKLCIEPFPELGYAPAGDTDSGGVGAGWRAMLPVAELLATLFSRVYPLRTLAG